MTVERRRPGERSGGPSVCDRWNRHGDARSYTPLNKVIVVEFEGVLVDSLDLFCRACIEQLGAGGHTGLATREKVLQLNDLDWYAALLEEGVCAATQRAIEARFAELCRDAAVARPFPGIREAVATLARRNTVVVISWVDSRVARDFCAAHGIEGLSDVIGSEVDPSNVSKIRRVKAVYGERSYWYIGDTETNMREGKAAGVGTIGVAWGWHGVERLRETLPDHIVYSPADLLILA